MEGFPRQSLPHPFRIGFLTGVAVSFIFFVFDLSFPSFAVFLMAYTAVMLIAIPLAVLIYSSKKRRFRAGTFIGGIGLSFVICAGLGYLAYIFLEWVMLGPP